MFIDNDPKLDFSNVLIRPKRSTLKSRSQVDISRTLVFPHTKKSWTGTPIIAANMDFVGTIEMATVLSNFGCMTALHKHYTIQDLVEFYSSADDTLKNNTFYSMGIVEHDISKLETLEKLLRDKGISGPDKFCIDVANGYTESFVDFVDNFREMRPSSIIMAGNVVTGEMTEELILRGTDIVKVGIGPGSVCTTRKMTGIGFPQLSSIIECADAAHGVKGHICGDGGCTVPGDLGKAFSGGADFLMLGGMLSGHDEGGGETITRRYQTNEIDEDNNPIIQVKYFKKFHGMSSAEAQNEHNGGLKSYRASEGKEVEVPYKGSVSTTIQEILGGIRSTCTYIGAEKLKELPKRATFIKVSQQKNDVYGKD